MSQGMRNEEILKYNGLKITKQRAAIIDILDNAEQPLSAEEIFIILSDRDIKASLSTVYRCLDIMDNKRIVSKIGVGHEGKSLYEINCILHRHYLFCIGCGKIIAINNCPLEGYEQKLENETGYHIIGHKLNIFGYCPECKMKEMISEN